MSIPSLEFDLVELSNQIKVWIDFMAQPPYGTIINFGVGIMIALFLAFLIYDMNAAKSN